MASAEELIKEAFFELQNVAPGATDEKRRRSRAIRLANRVIRRYPVSIEARQARSILRQLEIDDEVRRFADTHSHSSDVTPLAVPLSHPAPEPEAGPRPRSRIASNETDWKSLWLLFTALPYLQKRILIFVFVFIALFVAFAPFALFAAFVLFIKRNAIKPFFHRVLVSMGPDAARNKFRGS